LVLIIYLQLFDLLIIIYFSSLSSGKCEPWEAKNLLN